MALDPEPQHVGGKAGHRRRNRHGGTQHEESLFILKAGRTERQALRAAQVTGRGGEQHSARQHANHAQRQQYQEHLHRSSSPVSAGQQSRDGAIECGQDCRGKRADLPGTTLAACQPVRARLTVCQAPIRRRNHLRGRSRGISLVSEERIYVVQKRGASCARFSRRTSVGVMSGSP